MVTTSNVKKDILNAAFQRFSRYGYNKTTMAEIAKDCKMSTANIYRYYGHKKDIVAEVAQCHLEEIEDLLREIVKMKLEPVGKLKRFLLKNLHLMREIAVNEPKLNEITDFLEKERFDIIQDHCRSKTAMISEILSEGNRTGCFDIRDVLGDAETISRSILLIDDPRLIRLHPPQELGNFVEKLVDLYVRGIGKR